MSKKPHKHADIIKAWADGAEIEFFDSYDHEWKPMGEHPMWSDRFDFRIKPEPEPDFQESYFVHGNYLSQGLHLSARKDEVHNLILTFDGETGKLKSAEVLE